jgi:uncharacterized protein with beta-barrel porin domain
MSSCAIAQQALQVCSGDEYSRRAGQVFDDNDEFVDSAAARLAAAVSTAICCAPLSPDCRNFSACSHVMSGWRRISASLVAS